MHVYVRPIRRHMSVQNAEAKPTMCTLSGRGKRKTTIVTGTHTHQFAKRNGRTSVRQNLPDGHSSRVRRSEKPRPTQK